MPLSFSLAYTAARAACSARTNTSGACTITLLLLLMLLMLLLLFEATCVFNLDLVVACSTFKCWMPCRLKRHVSHVQLLWFIVAVSSPRSKNGGSVLHSCVKSASNISFVRGTAVLICFGRLTLHSCKTTGKSLLFEGGCPNDASALKTHSAS